MQQETIAEYWSQQWNMRISQRLGKPGVEDLSKIGKDYLLNTTTHPPSFASGSSNYHPIGFLLQIEVSTLQEFLP